VFTGTVHVTLSLVVGVPTEVPETPVVVRAKSPATTGETASLNVTV
jgi:hypothetical protein